MEHTARFCRKADTRSSELVLNPFRTDVLMEQATDLARLGTMFFGRMSKATSDRRSNYRVRSRDLFRTKAYVAAIFCSVRFCIKQLFVPLDSLSAIICSVSLFQVARFTAHNYRLFF